MNDRNNTIAGWVLFASAVALGTSIVAGEVLKGHAPEKEGYAIEGAAEDGGAEADKPIAFYLATADVAKGADVFKKCSSCHSIEAGGANGLGPAIYGVLGKPLAAHPGFAYSDALKGKGGTWTWDAMDAWLKSPKTYAPGTKMTFAGLGNPQDRANLIAYMNSMGSNLPLPPPPAADAPAEGAAPADGAAPAGDKAAAEAAGGDAAKAPDVPVLTPEQAAKGGQKNVGGDAAKVSR